MPCVPTAAKQLILSEREAVIDAGESYMEKHPDSEMTKAYNQVVTKIMGTKEAKVAAA